MRQETRKIKFMVRQKLAPYYREYRCDEDCIMSGCPGHRAEFEYHSVSDTFTIKLWGRVLHLSAGELGMVKDFIDMLEEK